MRKLFLLSLALLASFSLWAEPVMWKPTSADVTELTKTTSTAVVVGTGTQSFSVYSVRPFYNTNTVKLAWDGTENAIKATDGALDKAGIAIYIPSTADDVEGITVYMHTDNSRKTYYAAAASEKPASSGSTTADALSKTSTAYNFWTSFDKGKYYAFGGKTGGSGEVFYDSIVVQFASSTPIVVPVTEVTIAGPTQGIKDYASSFSATTDVKADSYKWFVNGTEQGGATAKTFNFTPTAAGDYSIVCKARNANNETDEWIASDPIAFKAFSTLFGELIKAVHTGKTTATVTGLIGGTADKSTESSGKINSNGYFGIQLASGNFQAGDTLNVNITGANTSAAVLIIYAEKTAENVILNTQDAGVVGDNKYVLPAAINNKNKLYIVRTGANEWNAVVNSISVIRPMATKSITESLTAVAINDAAISATDLATLQADHAVAVADAYVDAPEVKFTKHVTYIYEDDSQVETDEIVAATASEVAGAWQAKATINNIEYTVSAVKLSSVVVTYMDGEIELGTENVAVGGHPAQYAQYQSKSLYSFAGWYNNADLAPEHAVTIAGEVINDDATYYAKFEKAYASSINIEALILANGKSYNTKAQLGALHYASNYSSEGMDISNDSLNNGKGAYRNYDYLGLKVKSVSLLNFRIANGKTVMMKFGDVKTTPQVSINGGDYAAITITDGVYTHLAEAEEVISFKVTEGNKAVVIKQIVIGDAPELEDVVYAINYAATTNGTVSGWTIALPGETVTLTLTPDDGYKVASVTVNGGDPLEVSENKATFAMPAAAANVVATFSLATALDNTDVNAKAVKRLENGILVIEKNGRLFNAQGQLVK